MFGQWYLDDNLGLITEAVTQARSVKKVFLDTSQVCCEFCEISEISKNNFFAEQLRWLFLS